MDETERSATSPGAERAAPSFHGVRYQVAGVERAAEFYTRQLGFELVHQELPAFASISLGPLRILLSGPGASGSRPQVGPGGRPVQIEDPAGNPIELYEPTW